MLNKGQLYSPVNFQDQTAIVLDELIRRVAKREKYHANSSDKAGCTEGCNSIHGSKV